jgi:hypothetical protein
MTSAIEEAQRNYEEIKRRYEALVKRQWIVVWSVIISIIVIAVIATGFWRLG